MPGRYRSERGSSLLERMFVEGRYRSRRGRSLLERMFVEGRYRPEHGSSLGERGRVRGDFALSSPGCQFSALTGEGERLAAR